MKKIISILLALCLTGTLVSCRSKPKEEAAGAPSMPTKTSENNGNTSAEPKEQAAEKTDTATETEETKPAEKTVESNPGDEIAAKFGVKVDWDYVETKGGVDWKVKKEDPALRKQADQILKEKGWEEYSIFCTDHDMKYYYDLTNKKDKITNMIYVELKTECTTPGKIAPPFEKHFKFAKMEAHSMATTQEEYEKLNDFAKAHFRNTYVFTLDKISSEEIIAIIHKLEKLPYIIDVHPLIPEKVTY